jgi:4-hydroxybenzoate polyprenyltransferase
VYIVNDLADRTRDQQHPLKKNRPLASGKVTPTQAVVLLVVLEALGLGGAWFVNSNFFFVALAFVLLNLGYSMWLKHVVIVDAMTIALGFVLRALAGAYAIEVIASKWMLINVLFLALFLAFGKRRHELTLLEEGAIAHRKILGQYSAYLLDQLIGLVTATVVVFYMLYTFSDEIAQKFGTENMYLTIPFVVYGIFRYLYLIHQEDQGGSPTDVLIGDRPILFSVLLWIATFLLLLP